MPPQASNCMDHSFTFPEAMPQPAGTKVKCVLVGDGAVGKTSLVVSYTTNGYPTEYVPTAFDNYSVLVTVDNRPIRLQLCDTAGQDDFDTLRPLCYPSTDVFLLCFSVVSPTSFHNIAEKWIHEIRTNAPKTPIILVGTQSDLRNDVRVLIELANYNERPVTEAEAKTLADDIGAIMYLECSALTQKNLKAVFDTSIVSALGLNKQLKRSKSRKSLRKTSKKCESSDKRTVSRDSAAIVKNGWKRFCCFF